MGKGMNSMIIVLFPIEHKKRAQGKNLAPFFKSVPYENWSKGIPSLINNQLYKHATIDLQFLLNSIVNFLYKNIYAFSISGTLSFIVK